MSQGTYLSALFLIKESFHLLTAIAYSLLILSLTSSFILVPPLIIQLQNRNIALIALISSALLLALLQFINTSIWPSSDIYHKYDGRGLCDVEVKLISGLSFAIPCAMVCLFQQVSTALQPEKYGLEPSEAQKKRQRRFESILYIGLPAIRMAVLHIVQPVRYSLMGIHGCVLSVDTSWPTYLLVLIWPPLIGTIGFFCAVRITWRMFKHYRVISELFAGSDTLQMRKSRLTRQYILASVYFLIYMPLNVYLFCNSITPSLQSYSWSRIHPPTWSSRIEYMTPERQQIVFDFANGIANFVIFGVFGCSTDARCAYRDWYKLLRAKLTRSNAQRSTQQIARELEHL